MLKRIAMSMVMVSVAAIAAFADMKVDSLVWFDYQTTVYTNTNWGGTQNVGGQFFIERAYLSLSGDIGKDPIGSTIKGRLTIDYYKAQDGVGTGKLAPIKFAYVDYKFMDLNELVFSLGVIRTYFGNADFWAYPLPLRDAYEQYANANFSPTADLGISLGGKAIPVAGMTKGLLNYYFQFVNGEGYTGIFNETTYSGNQFCFQGTMFLSPLDLTAIGASYRNLSSLNAGGRLVNQAEWGVFGAANGILGIPLDIDLQYMTQDKTTYNTSDQSPTNYVINQNIASFTIGYGLFDRIITPYVRYDIVNENAGATNIPGSPAIQYSILYAGINIMPTKNLTFKPYYWINLQDQSYTWKFQMEYKMNFLIADAKPPEPKPDTNQPPK